MLFRFSKILIFNSPKKLINITYKIKEVLLTTCQIKLINKNKFAKAALEEKFEAYIVLIDSLTIKITIYLPQIF